MFWTQIWVTLSLHSYLLFCCSVTPWTAVYQASLSITNSRSLLKLKSIESVMPTHPPTISSSVVQFSSCPQSFPASGSFLMSWLFASSGQSIGAPASASILPMNIQGWFPLGWTGLILLSEGLSYSLVTLSADFPLSICATLMQLMSLM